MINAYDPDQLLRVLAESAAVLLHKNGDDGPESVLTRLCEAAVTHVPGVDFAGLTMRDRDGVLSSHGTGDSAIGELDRLQAELAEGPCVDVARPGAPVVVLVDDLRAEYHRWPRFAPAARERGVVGLLSVAMAPVEASPGALNLYTCTPAAFDDNARTIAGAFAMQAAIAVDGARRIGGLTEAIETRDVIGQAKGILMERFTLDEEAAFDLLVRSSQDSNVKLVDIARWLAAGASPDGAGHGPAGTVPEEVRRQLPGRS